MITYLIIATVWLAFTEFVFEKIGEDLSWEMKLLNFIFFPLVVPIFTYTFIKEFNKPF
tara:strand:+ start:751 stop:924 length:174 start_codon:yes stop_codon:yes gene_type:complete